MEPIQKKLLLIMPKFFDYPNQICSELKRLGYEVDFYDDRPSTNPWMKAAIRIDRRIVKKNIDRYFKKILEDIRGIQYDVVFLISGQSLSFSEDMLKELKNQQGKARFILYQWDSQRNFPYIINFHQFFDKILTFDRDDALSEDGIIFLPLFYTRFYEMISSDKDKEFSYDFCFVGTAHPQKYKFISKMSGELRSVFPRQFVYFYFPSVIVFYYRKIHDIEFKHAQKKEFHFTPLNNAEMEAIYKNSRCVMDSAQEGQTGLTIRAIEALGAKKKLITTNKDIINYDFYRPENIYVYEDDIDLGNIFFKVDFQDIDVNIYQKYSLNNWLMEVLR